MKFTIKPKAKWCVVTELGGGEISVDCYSTREEARYVYRERENLVGVESNKLFRSPTITFDKKGL